MDWSGIEPGYPRLGATTQNKSETWSLARQNKEWGCSRKVAEDHIWIKEEEVTECRKTQNEEIINVFFTESVRGKDVF
jgi:hypothetical protein